MPDGAAIDTVVLACTHFSLLEAELAAAFGPSVRFIDGSDGIARRIAYLTAGQTWARRDGEAGRDLALFTRGDPADAALMPALAAYGIDRRVMF
jgi:glutamate racemase